MRDGRLIGRDLHRTKTTNDDDAEVLTEFLLAYYEKLSIGAMNELLPTKIFVPKEIDTELVKKYFNQKLNWSPEINLSENQLDKSAMEMAHQNAIEDITRREREQADVPALTELKNLLNLDHLPVRIEGFDIAHIGGKLPVASLISFYNGNPDKKNYRYFRLKTTDGIIDDFASMREASARRYTRLVNDNLPLPDLILIDGGIGQVNAVQGVLDSLELDIPIIGLAKRDEEIYLPHNSTPISLPKRSDALRLLQRVRDETHRFATSRNQNLRTKATTGLLEFTKLPHIGKKRAAILNVHYGTLQGLVDSVEGKIPNSSANTKPSIPQPTGISALAAIACVSEEQATEIFQAAKILLNS